MITVAPVAQRIEQAPPKGKVGRSIRLWGATGHKSFAVLAKPYNYVIFCFFKNLKRI